MDTPHGLEELRSRLHHAADAFDDPSVYLAGVEDALDAVRALVGDARSAAHRSARRLRRREQSEHTSAPLPDAMAWFG